MAPISIGHWVESKSLCKVVEEKGKTLRSVGFNEKRTGILWLYPEEMVHYNSQSVLKVFNVTEKDIVEMTRQQVFQVALSAGVSKEALVAYSYLSLIDYVPRRRDNIIIPTYIRKDDYDEDTLPVAFDVYKHSASFRKSNPGTPYLIVFITSSSTSAFPPLDSLQRFCNSSEGSNAGCVVVDSIGNCLLYNFSTLNNCC